MTKMLRIESCDDCGFVFRVSARLCLCEHPRTYRMDLHDFPAIPALCPLPDAPAEPVEPSGIAAMIEELKERVAAHEAVMEEQRRLLAQFFEDEPKEGADDDND